MRQQVEHIKSYLKKLDQPFTVLDIGANAGYFSYRIVEDFNAQATMIEANDLKQLANNHHYGVVLALSIVHHFQEYKPLKPLMVFDSRRYHRFSQFPVNLVNCISHN